MTEEHIEQQMVERVLTQTAESEDEVPLAKVGRQRNVGIQHMGIELPPLNTTLVEAHRELARVSMGPKDMAIKNKNVWKTVKLTKAQLQKAQEHITELEHNVTMALQNPEPTSGKDTLITLQEETAAQKPITSKEKRATQLAGSEIDRLCTELHQSSDREMNIRAKGRRAVEALKDKLNA